MGWGNPEAQKEWKRLAPELERIGILTKADLAMFAAYCAAYGKMVWAEQCMKDMRDIHPGLAGALTIGKSGRSYLSGYANTFNKALEQILKFGTEFGLSPSSRSRIRTNPDSGDDDDLFT